MDERENEGTEDRRPTPVRMAMEVDEPQGEGKGSESRNFLDPRNGTEWIARVSGRSTSGVLPLRIIPLMEVSFFQAPEPDVPLRRALSQGESLEELDEEGLLQLFRVSGPFSPPSSHPEPPDRRQRRDHKRRRP